MTLTVDLYWSFRSPYSYLAVQRLVQVERDYDLAINLKLVRPLAMRRPDFFEKNDPRWMVYTLIDVARVAEMQGIPIGAPRPDPIVQDLQTLSIAAEQPYIPRLNRLGMLATEAGLGLPFIKEVSSVIWNGEVEGWNTGDHLAKATERAGLNYTELSARAESDASRLDAKVEQNEAEQDQAGHWGVPLMVFSGEAFFGQDRIDVLLWRMQQHGLKAR